MAAERANDRPLATNRRGARERERERERSERAQFLREKNSPEKREITWRDVNPRTGVPRLVTLLNCIHTGITRTGARNVTRVRERDNFKRLEVFLFLALYSRLRKFASHATKYARYHEN